METIIAEKKVALTKKVPVAEGTMSFSFAKPDGFTFLAGQTIDLTLVNPPETDMEGNTRTFSIASAPHEHELMIATRMRDTAFKRVLGSSSEGTELSFEGPFGSFTLHENASRPAVFLAGGIGITPFRSMILDALTRALSHRLVLFYSNRRPEDAAFLDEFTALAAAHESFAFVPTMTDLSNSARAWGGEQGYIDASMLARRLPEGTNPVYYLAGPQAMVTAMRTVLTGMGISNDDIRFEEFAGY